MTAELLGAGRRPGSIVVPTRYGRVVVYVDRSGVLRMRLLRRVGPYWRFAAPAPRELWLLCGKHTEDTWGEGKGASSYVYEAEMVVAAVLEEGVHASLDEVWEWLGEVVHGCLSCGICSEVRWETVNCSNMCYASWEVSGVEARPVPPAPPGDCYMWARTRHGSFECSCEELVFE